MLTVNLTYDLWTFFVADDVPTQWGLYISTDAGATWTQDDNNLYGTDSGDAIGSGVWVSAWRGDAMGVATGPQSNIIVVP